MTMPPADASPGEPPALATLVVRNIDKQTLYHHPECLDDDVLCVWSPGIYAWGWDESSVEFSVDLGTFDALEEALAAVNAHAPTVERFGKMALPEVRPRRFAGQSASNVVIDDHVDAERGEAAPYKQIADAAMRFKDLPPMPPALVRFLTPPPPEGVGPCPPSEAPAEPFALRTLPAPVRHAGQAVVHVPGDDDVSKDVRARIDAAAATYGGPLAYDDGRCPLVDLYQEALDAVAYATKSGHPDLVHASRALAQAALDALTSKYAPDAPDAPTPKYAPPEAPEKTTKIRARPTGSATSYEVDGRYGDSVIAFLSPPDPGDVYTAYGWSPDDGAFYTNLGIFPALTDALAAVNAHVPTQARFGRLVLA